MTHLAFSVSCPIYLHSLIIIFSGNRDTPYMVFEYMLHGDLAELLRKTDPSIRGSEPSVNLSKVRITYTSKLNYSRTFKTNYCLMQVKSMAECTERNILQYFRPSLSYRLSLRSLFCLLVLSRRLRQGLLYSKK